MTQVPSKLEIASQSVDDTMDIGRALGSNLTDALIIGLEGHLGAGKTQLVKGIALGNGLKDVRQVTSPTFTLVQEYSGRMTLYHLDLYRLLSDEDVVALGFDEWLRPGAAVVVEWADRFEAVLPEERLWIQIASTGDTARSLQFTAHGPDAVAVLERLSKECSANRR